MVGRWNSFWILLGWLIFRCYVTFREGRWSTFGFGHLNSGKSLLWDSLRLERGLARTLISSIQTCIPWVKHQDPLPPAWLGKYIGIMKVNWRSTMLFLFLRFFGVCRKTDCSSEKLGGFKYFLCSSVLGEDFSILTNIFQMGWNHQVGK